MSGGSQLRAALRLVVRGYLARDADPTRMATAPRRRAAIERSGIAPTPRAVERYLRATGGRALAAAGVLPPLFPATWETRAALELLAGLEPALPLGALVHAGSEVLVARPIPLGEAVRCRVELERAEPARGGMRLEIIARNWASGDRLCTESRHVFRLRSGPSGASRATAAPDLAGWSRLVEWRLDARAGLRYARASGDWNPIHLSSWTARPLGFRRPILHGFCTAAMVAHALGEQREGSAGAIRRLRVDFRAPLPLPGHAVLWTHAPEGAGFRVTDGSGATLYAEGECGVSPG